MKFLPKPKEVKLLTGEHALCYDGRIVLDGRLLGNGDTYAKVLQKGIKKETGMQYDIGYGVPGRKETGAIVLELDETRKSQQYVLQVTEEEIRIQGGDGAGVLYGVQTLCQMMHEYGALLPAVRIEDEPDLPVRGYYLDETRGRVLTLSYLKQVADRMAYYKLNQLQLYVEHTYLFSGLSEMWRDETPLTAEEIRELDAYCAKLHIELVPSIATFGHLYMLLSTKSYGDLCEFPDSWKEPFSFWDRMQHHTVDVSGGRAIELIKAGQIASPYYSPRGQELIPAAISVSLKPSDYVVTTYRGIHDQLAKGIPLKPFVAELFGRATGTCKGKGGPMHVTHVASGLPVTTGALVVTLLMVIKTIADLPKIEQQRLEAFFRVYKELPEGRKRSSWPGLMMPPPRSRRSNRPGKPGRWPAPMPAWNCLPGSTVPTEPSGLVL